MKSFLFRLKNAMTGWASFFYQETNGQIQAAIAIIVVFAGFFFNVSNTEWIMLLLCIGLVIGLEMMNSSLEKLCNHLHPQRHEAIRFIKDVAAGAVLWVAFIAVIVGAIIFLPRIALLLQA